MGKRFAGKVRVCHRRHDRGSVRQQRLGWRVREPLVGVNRRPSNDPTETLRRIKEVGGEGGPVVADVLGSGPGRGHSLREVAQRGGRLDYVVSNAGINPFMKWDETSIADFDALSETNFRDTWLVCTEAPSR